MPKPPLDLAKVDAATDLYRAITNANCWDAENNCITMAAFDDSLVSAYIVSLTTPEAVLEKFFPGTGLVKFNCGVARELEYDAVHEFDPAKNEDESHVHVYRGCGSSKRKIRAQQLANACTLVTAPNIDLLKKEAERRAFQATDSVDDAKA